MAKDIVTFLIGVILASAWWSMTIIKDPGKWELPALTTLGFIILLIFWLASNWDD